MGHEWASNSAQEIWDNELSVLAPSMAGIKYSRLEETASSGLHRAWTIRGHPRCTRMAASPAVWAC